MAAFTARRDGQTVFGSDKVSDCVVAVNSKSGSPSGLILVDSAGVEYVLWVDTSGDLIISTYANFQSETSTTVVGTQS